MKLTYSDDKATLEIHTVTIDGITWEEIQQDITKPWPRELCIRDWIYLDGSASIRTASQRWGMSRARATKIVKSIL